MSDHLIELRGLSKAYRIFRKTRYQMLDALGVPVPRTSYDEIWALRDVTLAVPAGQRMGVIGSNGAGKSTLLKIVAGLLHRTEGEVIVRGKVQALMELGTGFHPEFTGRENVYAALGYQGITGAEARRCFDDILEFSELEEHIDHPLKTYSAGMYARLAFSVTTAVKPEILIVDEVLGVGDAYFAGKSAERMQKVVQGGAVVLLASHALEQITMFCDEAIWMDRGRLVKRGPTLEVVKAYSRHTRVLEDQRLRAANRRRGGARASGAGSVLEDSGKGIVRWPGEGSLVIEEVVLLNAAGAEQAVFQAEEPMTLRMTFMARTSKVFEILPCVVLYRLDGLLVSKHPAGQSVSVRLDAGERRDLHLEFGPLNLGDGRYVFSVALFRSAISEEERYDLLDRSYEFRVIDTRGEGQGTVFHHPSRWKL